MAICIVTGSAGLVGSSMTRLSSFHGMDVVGIDNNMREYYFGDTASTEDTKKELISTIASYQHYTCDIRDSDGLSDIFKKYSNDIKLVIHAAAQPSHDWAAKEPITDFMVNANGTLNLLEMTRQHCPDATFVLASTNKVYGDTPNNLPLVELDERWEIDTAHQYSEKGIDESMSVDQTQHSLFGVSKLSADLLVQEYGRYFGMNTACFRAGCITGSNHAGAELHGFLAYLIKCAYRKQQYTVFGYQGKQVRDNIHADDLTSAFWEFFKAPSEAAVFNIGGGRELNCSIIEVVRLLKENFDVSLDWKYSDQARIGDHIWWISDTTKFQSQYPNWRRKYNIDTLLSEITQSVSV